MCGLLKLLSTTTVQEMTDAAREGMGSLHSKKTGSVSCDRKYKSLRERWMSRAPKPTESNGAIPDNNIVERNVYVKVKICEDRGKDTQTIAFLLVTQSHITRGFCVIRGLRVGKRG